MKYFPYNKSWPQITREERYFCAELFFEIRRNPIPFLIAIGKDNDKNYEVGFEVCLYRDFLAVQKKNIRDSGFHIKRTFDLTLFAEDEIIIIEAKAQQGFKNSQLVVFEEDKKQINKLLFPSGNQKIEIILIGIHSSIYKPLTTTSEIFKSCITWLQLSDLYPALRDTLIQADNLYSEQSMLV